MGAAAGGGWVLWALVALPASVGAVLCVAGVLAGGRQRWAPAAAIAVLALECALAVLVAVQRPSVSVPFLPFADFGLAVDGLAALVVPTVAVVALLVDVFAVADVDVARARFHGLVLLFVAAVVVTATATTLPALLFAWEVMGATSYALIGFSWWQRHRVAAGDTAFLTTRLADLGLYLAVAAALAGGGGLALSDLPSATPGWRDVVAAGVLVAALGKAAQLPFSFWLSRAMEGPSPVSALLHSAAMVAMGGYLLLRVVPLLEATGWAATATAWTGVVTAVLLGAVAVAQRDLKQLLAASTAAQLGFVVLAAGVGSVSGGATHLVAHAATKALLFLAAGAWLSALGTKQLHALRGVARRRRTVGVCATVGALSLAGVAPLSLWASKDEVLAAAAATSGWLYAAGLLAAVLSAAYAGKVLVLIWRHAPAGVEREFDTEEAGDRHVGWLEKAPLVVLAVPAAALGVVALPPVRQALLRMLGEQEAPAPSPVELVVSAVLALLTVAAGWRWGAPEPRWAQHWLGLGRLTAAGVVRPTERIAHLLARFDDAVLDRGVEATAAATLRAARSAARIDRAGVDAAVERAAAAVRRLGGLARRPQTGQLHHYYVQAVAVLAAGVLLLVLVR
ncbi:proton-conducting transporter transmembrane domain-containing protein [Kineococcus arenarius]|uniref:proton-conducting transporter transmembrane domain-containing protein n=1 Tax=unclassified Kineococcus TaxID=2621656 RepID=UPI003D7E507D